MPFRSFPCFSRGAALENSEFGIIAFDLIVRTVCERHADHVPVLVDEGIRHTRLIYQRHGDRASQRRRYAARKIIPDIEKGFAKPHSDPLLLASRLHPP